MGRIAYLSKIIVGLLVLGAAIVALNVFSYTPEVSSAVRWIVAVFALLIFLALVPFTHVIYRKMDELQQRLHEYASVNSLILIIASTGVAGGLQSLGVLPLFNLFWVFVVAISVWSVALMLSDRKYK